MKSDSPSPDSPSLGLLLHDAARAMRKRFEQRSEALGLSSAQWRLLLHVSREGRAVQSRLADLLEIEPISVSRLLDRMERAGWVMREADPLDRRVRVVVPTAKALQARDNIRAMADAVYDQALAGLSPAERAALVAGLATIVTNLAVSGADGICRNSPEIEA
ncbi:MarR family winged helix-turn-helix transcriptional regulator [Rhodobacter ferrooxidans]|uniref:Transcriptional regulator, MarR family n=1 Tax=Rhodobacter ferrooxidans TaxID=371731 RepID=C8S031_9RHOB|nr:MarR family transcriptional regulator [Rhodobacter sp. SW2]EEW25640.1 transcriptional regulator, MarR family [Rhodobacter sp. SW2]